MIRPRLAVCCLALAQASWAVRVHADEASDLDKKARAAFEAKDYTGAAVAFDEAYRSKPHPATKYNAALAWEKANELARAADAFESALASEGLDEGRAKAARTRLAVLKPMLGYVFVEKPIGATLSVAHVTDAPVPARFHLAPGSHKLVLKRRDGSRFDQDVVLKAGAVTTVAIEGGDLPVAEKSDPPAPASAPPPAPRATPAAKPRPSPSASCPSCTWGWVALGTGVAAAGAGAYFGVRTLSARSDFDDSGKTDADAHDRAVQSRTLTNVAFGVAAVAGGLGVYLLVSGRHDDEESATVSVGLTPSGVSSRWRF
ncbi:MAG: hypothetical protein HYZ29_02755 [Myxococcales bacterium]|nr:hypothetical protein [Myxococcales bacterium]